MSDSPWLNTEEAAEYAKRHIGTVTTALRDGSLVGHQTKKRGNWSIHRDDLDAWIRGERADVQAPKITRVKQSA